MCTVYSIQCTTLLHSVRCKMYHNLQRECFCQLLVRSMRLCVNRNNRSKGSAKLEEASQRKQMNGIQRIIYIMYCAEIMVIKAGRK